MRLGTPRIVAQHTVMRRSPGIAQKVLPVFF
jgi:hypothetical protein